MLRMETVVAPDVSPAVLPQLVAQSTLLELAALELEEKVQEELEENPALELKSETLPPIGYMPVKVCKSSLSHSFSDSHDVWANVAASYTLKEDLKWQFCATSENNHGAIGEYLIDAINEDGYLTVSLEEAARAVGVDYKVAEEALEIIQQLSPSGVGACNLVECLRLHLKQFDKAQIPPGVEAIIDNLNYFSGASSLKALCAVSGLSQSQTEVALDFIKSNLAPYPGRTFLAPWEYLRGQVQYICPDVILSIEPDRDGIVINIPQSERLAMRINSAYKQLDDQLRASNIRTRNKSLKEARQLVRKARQFIDNLAQRYRTMYKVMSAIVEWQSDFIIKGPAYLRPLNKKEIAASVDIHEATVCRATKGKYMLMPNGSLEPIDICFDDALPARTIISRRIKSENKAHPLSDQRLKEHLEEYGFYLARRTVAKYRLQLGIPPASQRKK